MKSNQKIQDKAKTLVLIDRHLQAESDLLEKVEAATQELRALLNSNPMHSLSAADCERLVSLSDDAKSATGRDQTKALDDQWHHQPKPARTRFAQAIHPQLRPNHANTTGKTA